ncbi:MAG: YfhO family protein [Ignavibacteriaceae bacterium]
MSKSKKTVKAAVKNSAKPEKEISLDSFIPPKYQTPFLLIVILLVFLFFFFPLYFGEKTFYSADILTIKSLQGYKNLEREGFTLWNPYVFGGLPAYAMAVGYKYFNFIWVGVDILKKPFEIFFANDYAKWTFYLIVLAYTMFSLMLSRTKDKLISLFSGITVSLSTGLIVFLYIGHVTKLAALCMVPLIFLLLLKFQNKISFLDFVILIITLTVFILSWHVQIIFYTLFAVMIYYIYYLLHYLQKKDKLQTVQILKSAILFLAGMIIALLIQADNLTQIYEYTDYSTRGTKSILEANESTQKQSDSDFYQYATNWSFSPGEILTFIIPSYYGFGKSTYQGPLSQNQPVEVNTYFGQMPFVDVAMYMGVIVFFLALFSVVANWGDPFVRFLTILSLIALLISFGRTFPIIYDAMFYYFPFFDKFRVPSMILVIVQICTPILAGLGLQKILSMKTQKDFKAEAIIKYSLYTFAGILVLSVLLQGSIAEWFKDRVAASGKNPQQFQVLGDYMADMFTGDLIFAFFFLTATFGFSFAYLKNKISSFLLITLIIFFAVFDLIRIDLRGETYVPRDQIENLFAEPDYVKVIRQQNDKEPFRILNLKQDGSLGSVNQNSNFNMYFGLQDLYGYSAVKPRSYQDFMDVLKTPANPTLWRMLNTKYIITDKEFPAPGLVPIYKGEKSFVYRNENVLPRVYFVNQVVNAEPLKVLQDVRDNKFDPLQIAFIHDTTLAVDPPDSTAYVKILKYGETKISAEAKASGNNFLFLGDTYYPKGWKAFVNGSETKIYRTNHGFRGIIVPKGVHQIEFRYEPLSFTISKYLAMILSGLTLIALATGIFLRLRKNKLLKQQ